MKTLDRYIIRSFLSSAAMWFVILMSLRIVLDLFVEMDEFTEQGKPFFVLARDIAEYYAYNALVYFTEMGGIIISASAAFTLVMMNRTNELTAIMASGVSMHRVALPIILCSLLLGGLVVVDHEVLVPAVADKLVRDKDEAPGKSDPPVRLMTDSLGAVWFSPKFKIHAQVMDRPVVVQRELVSKSGEELWLAYGRVSAGSARPGRLDGRDGWMFEDATLAKLSQSGRAWAMYPTTQRVYSSLAPEHLAALKPQPAGTATNAAAGEPTTAPGALAVLDEAYNLAISGSLTLGQAGSAAEGSWLLINPRLAFSSPTGRPMGTFLAEAARWLPEDGCWELAGGKLFLASDLDSRQLALSRSSRWVEFCSSRQLSNLIRQPRFRNKAGAELTRHVRATAPINNLVMLLLGLPFILSRERNIKASAGLLVLISGTFLAFIYLSRYMGLPPIWSAWLPALLFGPVAVVMFDAVRT